MSASLRDLSATDLKRLGGLREQCSAPLACSEHGAPHPCELCKLEGLLALSCTACGHQFTQGLSSLAERPCASGAEFASTGRIAFETEAVATLAEEQAEKERDRERERKRRQREENEARARQEAQALRERRLAERTARETRARAEADRRRELERAEAARLAEEERARAEAESRRESAERSLREAEAVAESRSQIAVLGSAVAALIGAVMAWRLPLLPLASTSWLNLILVYAPVVLVAWAIGAAPLYGKEVAHRSLSWWSALPWAIFCFAWPALIGLGACYLVSEISAAGAYFKALFYVSLFAFIGVTTMSCGGVAFSMEKPWPSAGVQPDFKGKRSWWLWLGVILTLSLNTALWQGQTLPLPGADDTYKVSNPVTPPIPVTLPPSAAVNTPPMPAAQAPAEKGFFGWVKGLFGGGTPAAPAAGPLLPLLGSPSSSSSRSQASGICIGKPNPAECVRSQLNRSGKLSPDDLRAAASQSLGQVATAVNAIDDLGKTQSQSILPAADVAIKMINELPKPQRGDRPTARALLTQGLNMFNQNGNAAEAVEILKRAHQTDPLDVQIVNDLAYVQMKNGQLDEAEDNLLATLMLAPKRTSAWANLAQLRTTSAPTDERAIEEAARYMVVAYWFSNDRVKTLNFINQQIKSGNGSTPFAVACKKALAKIGAESQVQGLSLADLEREEFTRKEWVVWQGRMKTDFEKTLAFKGSADLIVKAWEKFLVVWSLDNPLSREDESLRAEAIANKSKTQRIMLATQQPAATAPTPTRTAAGVNVNQCEKPEYPSASRRFEEEGTVALRFLVGVDGKVIQSEVEKSSGFKRLDEAARAGLSKCQFNPTLVDGKPEQAWASMKYTWRLE